jgi:hypothetical protein
MGSMTVGLAVQKFLNIETIASLKIKLHHSWKFSEELECAFDAVGKDLVNE